MKVNFISKNNDESNFKNEIVFIFQFFIFIIAYTFTDMAFLVEIIS